MKTYLLAMQFGPILPISYTITALSLLVEYWVDKYNLMRVHMKPKSSGKSLKKPGFSHQGEVNLADRAAASEG